MRTLQIIFYVVSFLFFCRLGGQETISDSFQSVSYSNNDGTLSFLGGWAESGSGETTDPSGGRIRVSSNELRFRNMDNAIITRTLDLSTVATATLTLDYNRTSGNESISVQLFDGASYATIATLSGSGSLSYNLNANQIFSNSGIRFRSASGGWGGSETVFIDDAVSSFKNCC